MKCIREACGCEVGADTYCSARCREQDLRPAEEREAKCNCGHPDCD